MKLRPLLIEDPGQTGRLRIWLRGLSALGFSSVALSAAALSAATLVSCVYDPDDVCGSNQVVGGANKELCLCAPGFVMVDTRCVACGEHEIATGSSCVCEEGYERLTPDAPCTMSVSALGNACDTESSPCGSAEYPRCEALHGTSGYCTKEGCTSAGDCEKGYSCNADQSPSFCEKPPPTGEGVPCTSSADCAGQEASFCDTFVLHACLVQGCKTAPDSCSKGRQCCAIPGFVNLCLPEGACQI